MMTQWFNRPPAAYTPTLLLLNLCLLLTLSTHHLTLAQTYYTPIVVFSAAIARTVTELYVIGGAAGANPGIRVPQLVSLDLNTSWNTTYPAWTKHADGPKQDLFPAAFSSDEKMLYVFHLPDTSSPFQWDSNTEAWKEMTNVKFDNATWQGIGAVTDPRTGLIYMAGGYNDDTNLSDDRTYLAMDMFDPVSETLNRTHFTMPPGTLLSRIYYGNVWCKARSSILYWGGHSYRTPPNAKVDVVSEFKPDTQTWALMVTTGITPAMRSDHCMVSNEDGSKVLIYGGRLDNTTVVGDIFILDTATQTWTPGAVGPPRMYPACAVAGDQLVIWGGKAADNVEPPRELIIYNFVTGQWATQYTPPASYRDIKDPPPLNRTTALWPIPPEKGAVGSSGGKGLDAASGSPVGAIVGGVVASAALVAVGVFVFRRRQSRGKRGQGGQGLNEKDERGGQSGLTGLMRQVRAPFTGKSKKQEESHPVSEEAELQRTLQELQDLENQQQELERKRLQLIRQQQVPYPPPPPLAPGQLRRPSEYSGPLSNHRPPPNNPEFVEPPFSSSAVGDSNFIGFEAGGGGGPGKMSERRTVQDTTGMSTNFMDWSIRPPNNPHAVVAPSGGVVLGGGGGGGVSRPVYLQRQQLQQQQQQVPRAMSM